MSLKNPVTRPGIDPGTVRLVAQRLRYPRPQMEGIPYGNNGGSIRYTIPIFYTIPVLKPITLPCCFRTTVQERVFSKPIIFLHYNYKIIGVSVCSASYFRVFETL
jgi:hypothetical protein